MNALALWILLLGACGLSGTPGLVPAHGQLADLELPVAEATHKDQEGAGTSYILPDATPKEAAARWTSTLKAGGWELTQAQGLPSGIYATSFQKDTIILSIMFARDEGKVIAFISRR